MVTKTWFLTIQEVGSALTAMEVNQVFVQAQNQDKMVFNLGDRAHVKKFRVACCSMIEIGQNESTDTKNARLDGVKVVLNNCWFEHYMVMPHRDEHLIASLENQMMIGSRSIPPKTSNYHANQLKLDSDCTKAGHNPTQTMIKDSKFHSYEEIAVHIKDLYELNKRIHAYFNTMEWACGEHPDKDWWPRNVSQTIKRKPTSLIMQDVDGRYANIGHLSMSGERHKTTLSKESTTASQ